MAKELIECAPCCGSRNWAAVGDSYVCNDCKTKFTEQEISYEYAEIE